MPQIFAAVIAIVLLLIMGYVFHKTSAILENQTPTSYTTAALDAFQNVKIQKCDNGTEAYSIAQAGLAACAQNLPECSEFVAQMREACPSAFVIHSPND